MKTRILQFTEQLRAAGIRSSTAECLDAVRAVAEVGIEAATLREALAASLVKDQADRPAFDEVFERFFRPPKPRTRRAIPSPKEGEGHSNGKGDNEGSGKSSSERKKDESRSAQPRPETQSARRLAFEPHEGDSSSSARHFAKRQALSRKDFAKMDAQDQEDCIFLAAELAKRFHAHASRRRKRRKRGRLDLRATLRKSIATGGVPLQPAFRTRRPGKIDLIVLCDHSYSVSTASRFLVSLLSPCSSFFRRVHLYAFVDHPVEISIEHGRVVPHEPIDLHARSDFGRTLRLFYESGQLHLNRNTLFLILGDGRNNRRPPRADLLAMIASTVREIVWLNPEPSERWYSGDSAMKSYEPHCRIRLSAASPHALLKALTQILD